MSLTEHLLEQSMMARQVNKHKRGFWEHFWVKESPRLVAKFAFQGIHPSHSGVSIGTGLFHVLQYRNWKYR